MTHTFFGAFVAVLNALSGSRAAAMPAPSLSATTSSFRLEGGGFSARPMD